MYQISATFDENTTNIIHHLIQKIDKQTSIKNIDPIHMTFTSFYSSLEEANTIFVEFQDTLKPISIKIIGIGFLKNTCYLQILMNKELYTTFTTINDLTKKVKKNRYYSENTYFPHITLAKHLNDENKINILKYIQNDIQELDATITAIYLYETNPIHEIKRVTL